MRSRYRVLALLSALALAFTLTACGGNKGIDVSVINSSGFDIFTLYISGTSDMGEDLLGEDVLMAGDSFKASLPTLEFNSYDLLITDEYDNEYDFQNLALGANAEIDVYWSDDLMLTVTLEDGASKDYYVEGYTVAETEPPEPDTEPIPIPSDADPLDKSADLFNVDTGEFVVTVPYPSTMRVADKADDQINRVQLEARNEEVGVNSLAIDLTGIDSSFDARLSTGNEEEYAYVWSLIRDQLYANGSYVSEIATDFVDAEGYYAYVVTYIVNQDAFKDAEPGEYYAVTELRYAGPTGYVLSATCITVENMQEQFYFVASNILNNMDFGAW
ncbi:MAG: hypothetical protein LBM18_05585 [Oscillospiraceae bacterium]|jgi:hypothetical protein|nr:hypothetical protein [Oscillospiraceae bacterium]